MNKKKKKQEIDEILIGETLFVEHNRSVLMHVDVNF